jgi:hypothetical protein
MQVEALSSGMRRSDNSNHPLSSLADMAVGAGMTALRAVTEVLSSAMPQIDNRSPAATAAVAAMTALRAVLTEPRVTGRFLVVVSADV